MISPRADTNTVEQGQEIKRIAILRALHLGDLLVAVPAFRSLRAGFPHTEITLIGLPWARVFVERFRRYVDRFVEFVGYPGLLERDADPVRTARFIREQQAYGYDLVIQMHGSGEVSNRLALDLGARKTAGYYNGEYPPGLWRGAPYQHEQSEILRNLDLARLVGGLDCDPRLEFSIEPADQDEVAHLLAGVPCAGRPLLGIHPGSRSPARRWPPEYFAAVADVMVHRVGAQIILTGGVGDGDAARAVSTAMENPVLDVSGRTSLGGLAALISRLDLFISNDTGPAHLACAVDTPSVAIFGPADPIRWAPLDSIRHPIVRRPVACSPCLHWECPIDHRCLRWLDPGMVLQVAAKLLTQGEERCSA